MDKSEVSNAEEIKNMIKVRNELGWQEINNLIQWLNPGGLCASLVTYQTRDILAESRNALGWEIINEFIKQQNPGGLRDSLLR